MLKRVLKEVREYKTVSILTPVFMILEVIMEMVIPLLIASLIDKGIDQGNMGEILKYGGLMVLAAFVGLFGGALGAYCGAKAATGVAKNVRRAMFANIQTFSFENIDKFSTAGLVTRLTTDVTNVQNAYQMILRMGMRAPATVIVALALSFKISPSLSSVYFIAVLVIFIVIAILVPLTGKMFKAMMEAFDELNAGIQENISGVRVVKAYVREAFEKSKFYARIKRVYDCSIRAEKTLAFVMPIMSLVVYSCILLISWFGARQIVNSTLTTGELTSMLSYCGQMLFSLMMFAMLFVTMTMSLASVNRIGEVLSEETTITNKEKPIMSVADGSVSFEHVTFGYNKSAEDYVLKDISFDVKSGETIGIIGPTGSSKSTLVAMISRLYDVDKGSVKVGGIDVRDYDVETIRNEVSVVLQTNVLFSGTILENLRCGKADATEEECKRAARLACADEFISAFPNGYETYIEQGGTNVSGGQRQRLCIARALLKAPKVLILDDSTSAVDTTTDANIRRAFREEIPNTTKFIIAQRISSVQDADRILVLNDGAIDGFGTHEQLLETNEIYRTIYEAQTGAGSGDFDENGGEN